VVVVEEDPSDGPPDWVVGQLARVEANQIVIRDPIQFEKGTARILPESRPILQQVAGLLQDHPRIVHLVIEGHASEEGDHNFNYDLSIERARSIWEQLVRAEVHPDRLSYRGMGEVVPVTVGADESALAVNRRVEFRITAQQHPLDPDPVYRTIPVLPWETVEQEEESAADP
jgi:outer membrane protein OmpA-like peptidoglycan-associated protein